MQIQHTEPFYSRTFAKIDLTAIVRNFDTLAEGLGGDVKKMAVVKANGYGHGSVPVARVLECRADYFGVACLDEALTLREAGIRKPILILSYTAPFLYDTLIENHITATLYSLEEAELLAQRGLALGKRAKVHAAVDTGMGRIGVTPDEAGADIIEKMAKLEGLHLEGLFSHYACADHFDKTSANEQTRLFDAFLEKLDTRGVKPPICHICNSAGSMELSKHYDMCRFGISLYGMYPSDEVDKSQKTLLPAMEVVSHVICVKTVEAGTKIGYGHQYTAPAARRIATVSIGYADGFRRCLTEGGYVLIRGKKAPLTGRVCMDQIMVDVTDIPDTVVGDHAVILGKSGEAEISAETLGSLCHSFHYEVVCGFLPRVKRLYYLEDKRIAE